MDKLFKREVSAVGRYLFEGSDDIVFVYHFSAFFINDCGGHLEISEEKEKPFHSHMDFVVLKSIKGHMLAHSEHVGTVMLEYLLEMA